ncbi:MAG: conjugal transfer protein TrbG, partial [Sulfitobacter sp.]
MKALKPTILSIALTLIAAPALAEYIPRSGGNDNRVRVATYQDGQVYR